MQGTRTVNLIQQIKNKILRYKIEKLSKAVVRKRKLCNFADVRSIGVVFDFDNEEGLQNLIQYADYLKKQGKAVKVIGFINAKEVPPWANTKTNIEIYCKTNLNFIGEPQGVSTFLSEPFDWLVAIDNGENIQIEYMTALSVASCKFCREVSEHEFKNFDFQLKIPRDNDVRGYFEYIKDYTYQLTGNDAK